MFKNDLLEIMMLFFFVALSLKKHLFFDARFKLRTKVSYLFPVPSSLFASFCKSLGIEIIIFQDGNWEFYEDDQA
ncbi:hypothetical protein NIES4075_58190 [Tolypothrix sp. NIES-4075]|uniref:hypothetical protein n=1 Tax=Tolypothrix sp. NIES-4075 TaxID=2005459 RepID=UPI000B5CFBC3|nr:hypothetical protein [Tolypothrix sp. NIES-4075]GAX44800.1 hypothetical protein NIES4075_58190 [Tolypothrix sp. NIES-4075]